MYTCSLRDTPCARTLSIICILHDLVEYNGEDMIFVVGDSAASHGRIALGTYIRSDVNEEGVFLQF